MAVKKSGKQAQKSSFAETLKTNKKAVLNHRKDETVDDAGGDLPPGLIGIAKLKNMYVGTYKSGTHEGESFFRADAVVLTPKVFQGMPVAGMHTSIMEPMCDTPEKTGKNARKTLDEHLAWVMNSLRKLGADTSDASGGADLDAMVEALVEEQPTFRFRTWASEPTKQYPTPRTNHSWGKLSDAPDEDEEDDGVEDDSEEEEDEESEEEDEEGEEATEGEEEDEESEDLSSLGQAADEGDEAALERLTELAEEAELDPDEYKTWAELAEALAPEEGEEGEEDESEDEGESEGEEEDLEALGEAAEGDDEEAQERLNELAAEYELDPDDYSWIELASAISEASAEGEEAEEEESEEEEEEEAVVPEKEDVYMYQPPKAKKKAEVEITAVNKAKKTVSAKDLASGKLYKDVPWSKLSNE